MEVTTRRVRIAVRRFTTRNEVSGASRRSFSAPRGSVAVSARRKCHSVRTPDARAQASGSSLSLAWSSRSFSLMNAPPSPGANGSSIAMIGWRPISLPPPQPARPRARAAKEEEADGATSASR